MTTQANVTKIEVKKELIRGACDEGDILHVQPGAPISMVAWVTNTGTTPIEGYTVTDELSPLLVNPTVTVTLGGTATSTFAPDTPTPVAGTITDTINLPAQGDRVEYCIEGTAPECEDLESIPSWFCNAIIVKAPEPACVELPFNPGPITTPAKLTTSATFFTKPERGAWVAFSDIVQIGGEFVCAPSPALGTISMVDLLTIIFGVGEGNVALAGTKPLIEKIWNSSTPLAVQLASVLTDPGIQNVALTMDGTVITLLANGEEASTIDIGPIVTQIATAIENYVQSGTVTDNNLVLAMAQGPDVVIPLGEVVAANGLGAMTILGTVLTITTVDGTPVTVDLSGVFDEICTYVLENCPVGADLVVDPNNPLGIQLLSGAGTVLATVDLSTAIQNTDTYLTDIVSVVGTIVTVEYSDGTTSTIDFTSFFDATCQYIFANCPVGASLNVTGTDPLTVELLDGAGNVLSSFNMAAEVFLNLIDYDATTNELVFTRNDGTTFTIPVPPILQDLIPAACDVTVCWISGDLTAGSDATFEVEVRETSGVGDLTDITIEYPGGSVGPLTVAAGDSTTQTFVVTLPDPLPYSVDVVVSDVNGIKCRSCLLVSAGGATPVTDHLPVMFGFKGDNGNDLRDVAVGDTAVIRFVAGEQSGQVDATGVTWSCVINWAGPATCTEETLSEETFVGVADDPGGTYLQTSTTGTPGSNWTQVSDFTTVAEADRFEAALNAVLAAGSSRSTTVIPTLSPDPIFNLHGEMNFTTSRPTPTQVQVNWVAAGFDPPSKGVVSPPCPADPDWVANQSSIISMFDSAIGTTNPNLTTIFTTKIYTVNTTYGSVTPTIMGTPPTTIAAGTYEEVDFQFTMTQEMKDAKFVRCECLALPAETGIPAIDYVDFLPTAHLTEEAPLTAGDHLPVLEVLKNLDTDGNFWMTRVVGEMVPIRFYVKEQSGLADATLTGAFGSVEYVNGDVPPLTSFVNSDSITITTAFPVTVPAGGFIQVDAEILFTQEMRDAGWVRCTMGVVATETAPFPTRAIEDYIYTAEPGGGTALKVGAPALPEYNALASFADINFLPDDAALVPTIQAAIQGDPAWMAAVPVTSHAVVGLGNRDFGNWWHAIAAGDEIWDIPSNTLANELFIGRAIFTNDALRWQLSGAAPTASTLLMSSTSVSPTGIPAYIGVFVVLDGAVVAHDSSGINGGTNNATFLVDLLPFLNDFERLKFFVVARTGTPGGLTDYLVRYLTIINY